jgi:hypothetical protein
MQFFLSKLATYDNIWFQCVVFVTEKLNPDSIFKYVKKKSIFKYYSKLLIFFLNNRLTLIGCYFPYFVQLDP